MVVRVSVEKRNDLGYENPLSDDILLGKKLGMDIYMRKSGKEIEVFAFDRRKVNRKGEMKLIGDIVLWKEKMDNCWSVSMVRIDSQYKGFGLAKKIYKFLLSKMENFVLVSGQHQSVGGRYIWNELAKDKSINIFARKSRTSKFYGQPKVGMVELLCDEFPLYNSKAMIFAEKV